MNMAERMKHFNVPGVSVTHFADNTVQRSKHFGVLEKGTGNMVNNNSIFHACSISKMITALCVLRLVQDGVLDLYKDVNEYLSSWKISESQFTNNTKITLANLLAHQAGFYDDGEDFSLETARILYVPETNCEYSDIGYRVISQVLLDALGETVPQIAARLIFEPLGLKRAFFWEPGKDSYDDISMADCAVGHDNSGNIVKEIRMVYPNVEGAGLWITSTELAHIVIDLVKSYHNQGGIVLNHETARLMLTPYGCVDDIALGVFLDKDEKGRPYFFSQGWGIGMQCKLRAYYEDQSQGGIVVMTNSEPGMEQDAALIGEIIKNTALSYSQGG